MNNMFLAVCKRCNEYEPHLMDNMAVARFEKSSRPAAMLCVEPIEDKLQLTMRVSHLGVGIIFPGMSKLELISRWVFGSADPFKETPESDLLFDAAILRMMDDYMSKDEVASIRRELMEEAKVQSPQGVPAAC
ncbi:hypothetical protein ACLBWT_18335 [Paenibacillus sp. D51F]